MSGYSLTAGLVLLVPGIIVDQMLLHMVAGYDSPASVFVVSTGQVMTHLAIGSGHRQQSARSGATKRPAAPIPG